MGGCAAVGCTNSSQKGYLMKHFPRDPVRRQEWLVKMKRVKWKPTDHSCLCEVHFEPQMWEKTRVDGTRKLKRDAVPTIFSFLQAKSKKKKIEEEVFTDERQSSSPASTVSNESSENQGLTISGPQDTVTSTINNEQQQYSYQEKVYNPFSQSKPQNAFINSYPIHQDVRFSRLPFYEVIAELLKPSSLIPNNSHKLQEKTFYFYLTPQQSADIVNSKVMKPGFVSEFEKQVQLRFCLSETICEQEDYFPSNIAVKVNNRICPLPSPLPANKSGVEPKRPSRPVNISPFIKLSSTVVNTVTVLWTPDFGPGFTVAINLVKKLSSFDLVQRLKEKGPMNSDYTRSLIKEKLNEDSDSEIMTTCLRVSLLCPLGKMRMTSPCRAITCKHLQCFDSSLFLQMNERKQTWSCPVCDKPALYSNLIIDGYFQEVLSSPNLPSHINEIELHKDGSWSIHGMEKSTTSKLHVDDTIEIIGDETEAISDSTPTQSSKENNFKPIEIIDLVLSDSDEESNHPPAFHMSDTIISLDSPSPPNLNIDTENEQNELTLSNSSVLFASNSYQQTVCPSSDTCSSSASNLRSGLENELTICNSSNLFNSDNYQEPTICPSSDSCSSTASNLDSEQPTLNTIFADTEETSSSFYKCIDQELLTSSIISSTINQNDLISCLPLNSPLQSSGSIDDVSNSNI